MDYFANAPEDTAGYGSRLTKRADRKNERPMSLLLADDLECATGNYEIFWPAAGSTPTSIVACAAYRFAHISPLLLRRWSTTGCRRQWPGAVCARLFPKRPHITLPLRS